MSMFRDDHEAALVRLAVLEHEHARVLAENARLREDKPARVEYVPVHIEQNPSRVLLWTLFVFAGLSSFGLGYISIAG